MEIAPKDGMTLYEDVLIGDVFFFSNQYYMATNDCEDGYDSYNAINLNNGELCFFDSGDSVTVVKATLTIGG